MNDHDRNRPPSDAELASVADSVFALPGDAEALQARLLAATQQVQRGRRWRRRAAGAAVLLCVYGLGFGSARWLQPGDGTPAPAAVPAGGVDEVLPPSREPSDPWQLEQLARTGPRAHRSERLRRAGDLYLEQRGDVTAAVRCYSDYIALAPADRDARADDSWLLVALKRDAH